MKIIDMKMTTEELKLYREERKIPAITYDGNEHAFFEWLNKEKVKLENGDIEQIHESYDDGFIVDIEKHFTLYMVRFSVCDLGLYEPLDSYGGVKSFDNPDILFGQFVIKDLSRKDTTYRDGRFLRKTSREAVLERKWKNDISRCHCALTNVELGKIEHMLLTIFAKNIDGRFYYGAIHYNNKNQIVDVLNKQKLCRFLNAKMDNEFDVDGWSVVEDDEGNIVNIISN
jgi:hypothetical protein